MYCLVCRFFFNIKSFFSFFKKDYCVHSVGRKGLLYVQSSDEERWFVASAQQIFDDPKIFYRFGRLDRAYIRMLLLNDSGNKQ